MQFENVTAIAKANVYFEGNVVSHGIIFPDGSKKTLGLIYPGDFHFSTLKAERMEIIAGACNVRIDGETAPWLRQLLATPSPALVAPRFCE